MKPRRLSREKLLDWFENWCAASFDDEAGECARRLAALVLDYSALHALYVELDDALQEEFKS